jgi:beta-lactamase class C
MKGSGIGGRRRWIVALAGLLLPPAAGTEVQTSPRWHGAGTDTAAPASHAPAPRTSSALAIRSPASAMHRMPLAHGFDVREFERMAEQLATSGRVPGLALAIVQNGRVLSARGYGVTDVSAPQPVDAHTVFRLASLSKGFAGTLAALLVADGRLHWDHRVADWLPAFRLRDPYATRQVTIADVLSHRTGLRHHTFDRDLERYTPYRALAQRLAEAPLACSPGDCYGYQNIAFSLIGDVVAAATGTPFEQALQQRIFAPLGMRNASVGLHGIESSPRWARPHVRSRGGWTPVMPKPTYYEVAPAAGVNASIADMAQWLLAQGGHRPDVLPAPLLATLHAPLIATPAELRGAKWRRERLFAAGYGLGWRRYEYAGQPLVFHGGAVQGYRAVAALLPSRDLGIAIVWNSDSALPSGLLPTILDRAIGLPAQPWLDIEPADNEFYGRTQPASPASQTPGVEASRATAAPR